MRATFTLLLLLVAIGCGSASADGRHLRVLLLGNSLTSTNDLPGTLEAFGAAVGTTIETRTFAPGGFSLEDHWAAGAPRAALDEGGWDAVLMQQGPSSLPSSGQNLTQWATRWAAEARAHGVRPVLWTVWPDRLFDPRFAPVIFNYRQAAVASKSALFPVGVAWRNALARAPRPRLYGPDAFHPAPLGTYLAAVVIYAGLTGELPRTLPRRVGAISVDARTAAHLRAAAAAALREGRG
jgi:hypothetical protein